MPDLATAMDTKSTGARQPDEQRPPFVFPTSHLVLPLWFTSRPDMDRCTMARCTSLLGCAARSTAPATATPSPRCRSTTLPPTNGPKERYFHASSHLVSLVPRDLLHHLLRLLHRVGLCMAIPAGHSLVGRWFCRNIADRWKDSRLWWSLERCFPRHVWSLPSRQRFLEQYGKHASRSAPHRGGNR